MYEIYWLIEAIFECIYMKIIVYTILDIIENFILISSSFTFWLFTFHSYWFRVHSPLTFYIPITHTNMEIPNRFHWKEFRGRLPKYQHHQPISKTPTHLSLFQSFSLIINTYSIKALSTALPFTTLIHIFLLYLRRRLLCFSSRNFF